MCHLYHPPIWMEGPAESPYKRLAPVCLCLRAPLVLGTEPTPGRRSLTLPFPIGQQVFPHFLAPGPPCCGSSEVHSAVLCVDPSG